MKAFFDTSVLVPTLHEDLPHHEECYNLVVEFDRAEAACAAHSLAEVYATLTRMPVRPRVGPEQALLFVDTLRENLTVVTLDAGEYMGAIEAAARNGIVGGGMYDALIAACALKVGAEKIYTYNTSHFARLGGAVAARLHTP
jgi:predicted nucleic acid-binding protein